MLTRIFIMLSVVSAACGPSGRKDPDANGGADAYVCPTSISGKVFAPNGTLPLANVLVYVPGVVPPPFTPGVQCEKCASEPPGGAFARATTDPEGKFKLEGVTPGTDVPVVVTTGKWRRIVTVPTVSKCVDNPQMDGFFRLPRNKSEGDLPKIAMVTGGCDPLACILSKLGLGASEFGTDPNGNTAVVFYNGNGGTAPGTPQASTALWTNLNELKKYDMVINSCECDEHNENKTAPDVLKQYADIGGRVFGSHFQYTWTKNLVPAWQPTANWVAGSNTTPDLVDTSHPDGMALSKWLVAVGASAQPGEVQLGTKTPSVSTVNPPTTRWLYSSGSSPATTHYLSFKTPVGTPMENQCGKVVYAGLHVASGSVGATFPSGCNSALEPDEKMLVYLLFDLGKCVDVIL
jgi:hypothetical protein